MIDREKVIKGLEHCISRYVDGLCDDCPYMGELDKSYMIPMKCKEIIMRDALDLLKDDETRIQYLKDHIAMCKEEVEREQENASKRKPVIVCPHCGKRVK